MALKTVGSSPIIHPIKTGDIFGYLLFLPAFALAVRGPLWYDTKQEDPPVEREKELRERCGMKLSTAAADGLDPGSVFDRKASTGFLAAYYKALLEGPGGRLQVKYQYNQRLENQRENCLGALEDSINCQDGAIRQRICDQVTEFLYDNGAEVDRWPYPKWDFRLRINDPILSDNSIGLRFHYFGADYGETFSHVGSSREFKNLHRISDLPREPDQLPHYQGPLPEKPVYADSAAKLEKGFYASYEQKLEDAQGKLKQAKDRLSQAKAKHSSLSGVLEGGGKKEKTAASPLRRVLGLLLILFILINALPPLFCAATGLLVDQYNAAFEALQAGTRSGGLTAAVCWIFCTVQIVPALIVHVVDWIRGGSIVGGILIGICMLVLAWWVLAAVKFIGQHCGLIAKNGAGGRAEKKGIKKVRGGIGEAEKELRQAEEAFDAAQSAVIAVMDTRIDLDKRFIEYKKTAEYQAAVKADRAQDRASAARYQKEMDIYDEKVALSQRWQEAWRDYLIENNKMILGD